jgi:hydrogenase maturation factor HypE
MTKKEVKHLETVIAILERVEENQGKMLTHNGEQDVKIQAVESKADSIQKELKEHKDNDTEKVKNKQWTIGQIIVIVICAITLLVQIL